MIGRAHPGWIGALVGALALAASPPAAASTPAPVPAPLQALEQGTAALAVDAETFTRVTHSAAVITETVRVRRRSRVIVRRRSEVTRETGSAGLSPPVAEIDKDGTPQEVQIGSTLYIHIADAALRRRTHGRSWLELDTSKVGSPPLFPGRGGSLREIGRGGAGPYAGLLNLLSTATGTDTELGSSVVDGQQAEGFRLTVHPAALIAGLSPKETSEFEALVPPTTLEVFLAGSGQPLRTVETATLHISGFSDAVISTLDLTPVAGPLVVTAPAHPVTERELARDDPTLAALLKGALGSGEPSPSGGILSAL